MSSVGCINGAEQIRQNKKARDHEQNSEKYGAGQKDGTERHRRVLKGFDIAQFLARLNEFLAQFSRDHRVYDHAVGAGRTVGAGDHADSWGAGRWRSRRRCCEHHGSRCADSETRAGGDEEILRSRQAGVQSLLLVAEESPDARFGPVLHVSRAGLGFDLTAVSDQPDVRADRVYAGLPGFHSAGNRQGA